MKGRSRLQGIIGERVGWSRKAFQWGWHLSWKKCNVKHKEKSVLGWGNSIWEACELRKSLACFRPEKSPLGRNTVTKGPICSQTTDVLITPVIWWAEPERIIIIWIKYLNFQGEHAGNGTCKEDARGIGHLSSHGTAYQLTCPTRVTYTVIQAHFALQKWGPQSGAEVHRVRFLLLVLTSSQLHRVNWLLELDQTILEAVS